MTALEYRTCPGCGVRLPVSEAQADGRYNASAECRQLYGELAAYTLTRGDPDFVHQLAVDAYGAQHAGEGVRPMATAFALIGLYLTFERGYSGRQVQAAHGCFAGRSKRWPRIDPPPHAGALTIADVLRAQAGEDRDSMLRRWGKSVWEAWREEHARRVNGRTLMGRLSRGAGAPSAPVPARQPAAAVATPHVAVDMHADAGLPRPSPALAATGHLPRKPPPKTRSAVVHCW